jgi:hypothetical protein
VSIVHLNKRRYLPFVGQYVHICWNSGNDKHADECIPRAKVIHAGRLTLWVHADADGVKIEQDVFIKYDHITLIQEVK